MDMSEEEKDYIIRNVDELIERAKHVGAMACNGTFEEYEVASEALARQRYQILSIDGIET